jgi:hypothetical protein
VSLVGGAGPTTIIQQHDLSCEQPSLHNFRITDSVSDSDSGADPNMANNTQSTTMLVACISQTDVKITGQTIVGFGANKCNAPLTGNCSFIQYPFPKIDVGQVVPITVEKDIHNSSPATSVDVDITRRQRTGLGGYRNWSATRRTTTAHHGQRRLPRRPAMSSSRSRPVHITRQRHDQ